MTEDDGGDMGMSDGDLEIFSFRPLITLLVLSWVIGGVADGLKGTNPWRRRLVHVALIVIFWVPALVGGIHTALVKLDEKLRFTPAEL